MNSQEATQEAPITMNGINVTSISDTIKAVQEDKELAMFQFRATNKWLKGGHNRSRIKGFYGFGMENEPRADSFVLDADLPGHDAGPTPLDSILHALTACLTTTMVYHAASKGISIKAVDSESEGDLDLRGFLGISDNVRKGYQGIRVQMRVESDAKAEMLCELAKHSPVYEMVSSSVPVDLTVKTY